MADPSFQNGNAQAPIERNTVLATRWSDFSIFEQTATCISRTPRSLQSFHGEENGEFPFPSRALLSEPINYQS